MHAARSPGDGTPIPAPRLLSGTVLRQDGLHSSSNGWDQPCVFLPSRGLNLCFLVSPLNAIRTVFPQGLLCGDPS